MQSDGRVKSPTPPAGAIPTIYPTHLDPTRDPSRPVGWAAATTRNERPEKLLN